MSGRNTGFRDREHLIHIYLAAEERMACDHSAPQDWLIHENWIDYIGPELLCRDCLEAIGRPDPRTPEEDFVEIPS